MLENTPGHRLLSKGCTSAFFGSVERSGTEGCLTKRNGTEVVHLHLKE